MHPPIAIKETSIGYGANRVLSNLDFTIHAGERLAVLGRSGAGKSTLLNVIFNQCAAHAALVPQAHALVGSLSVFHNVFMGQLNRHSTFSNLRTLVWPSAHERAEVAATLRLVGLSDKLFEKAGTLSGGQQQRTSIARALFAQMPMIVGDEPVSALDRTQADALLARMQQASQTLVLAMHDVPLALAYATRIMVIEEGKIALDAPAKRLAPSDLAPYYERAA